MIRKIEVCIKLAEEILEKNQSLNLAENMNTREILLRNEKYIISNIFQAFSWLLTLFHTVKIFQKPSNL